MVEALERVMGVRASVKRTGQQPGDVPQTWADISKARRELGYEPRTSLEQGMAAFREWLLAEDTA
jgi:UDP-glucuronate 4-epimerase